MSKIKLIEIVAQFTDSADLSEHHMRRLYNIGVRGAKELNQDVYGAFKSLLLSVNDNQTVDIPKDFIRLSKLGVLNDAGEICTMQVNNDLTMLRSQYLAAQGKIVDVPVLAGGLDYNSLNTASYIWFNYIGYGFEGGCNLYGLGSGGSIIGQYRIDENAGQIYLSQDWPYNTLLMEYISDGYDCDTQDFMIDTRASEAMVAWLRWQQAIDLRKKYSQGDVLQFRREYYNQKRISRLRINSADITQMQMIYRQHIKLAARA